MLGNFILWEFCCLFYCSQHIQSRRCLSYYKTEISEFLGIVPSNANWQIPGSNSHSDSTTPTLSDTVLTIPLGFRFSDKMRSLTQETGSFLEEGMVVVSWGISSPGCSTKHHRLGGVSNRCLFLSVLEAENSRSGSWQGWWAFPEAALQSSCVCLSPQGCSVL